LCRFKRETMLTVVEAQQAMHAWLVVRPIDRPQVSLTIRDDKQFAERSMDAIQQ
jgi:hypothetical protein